MKRSFSSATVIAAYLFGGCLIAGPVFDHLEPPHLGGYPQYRKILLAKLSVTPFDCGRLIVLPFSDTEGSQSVYSKFNNGQHSYYVTRISREKNLWDETDGGRYARKAASIRTHRIDAAIPERTAKLLRQVWLAMLQGPQRPRPTPPPSPPKRGGAARAEERFILMDPSFLEFSIEPTDGPPLVGVLNISAGYAGPTRTSLPRAPRNAPGFGDRLRMLVEVSDAVYQYSIAKPEQRPAIANEINRKAIRLLETLKQERQDRRPRARQE